VGGLGPRRGHAGNTEQEKANLSFLRPVRERVLDNAKLRADDVVLDVGAGDGLIAFGALDRLGPQGQVIFNDISQALLDHSRLLSRRLGSSTDRSS
jgi:arsenite methyltransferase